MKIKTVKLHCDMTKNCTNPITHIDHKGFIYCETHGIHRQCYTKCRKLKQKELMQLTEGKPLGKY